MNNSRPSLWKCPMCETLNNGTEKCTMCGYTRVDPFARPNVSVAAQANESDKKLKLAIIIAAVILLIVVGAGVAYMASQSMSDSAASANVAAQDDYDDDSVEPEEQETIYVINTNSQGMNVRSAPTKNSKVIAKIGYGDTSVKMKDLGYDEEDSYGFTWHYVELSTTGQKGYVRNDIVKLDE